MSTSHPPTSSNSTKKQSAKHYKRRYFLISALVIIGLGAALTAYLFAYNSRFMPHATISGMAVGGLTYAEGKALVVSREQQFLKSDVVLKDGNQSWTVHPADLDTTFVDATAIQSQWQYGRQGTIWRQIAERVHALITHRSANISLGPLSATGKTYLQDHVLKTVEQPVAETSLNFSPDNVTVVQGVAGQRLNEDALTASLTDTFLTTAPITLALQPFQPQVTVAQAEVAQQRASAILASPWHLDASGVGSDLSPKDIASWLSTAPTTDSAGEVTGLHIVVNQQAVRDYLGGWAGALNKDPQNVRVKLDTNNAVVVDDPGHDGLHLDLDQTAVILTKAFSGDVIPSSHVVSAVTAVTPAAVNPGNLASLGIVQRIGTATTDFSGSTENRIFNIKLGQSKLNQILLTDAGVFSTIGYLAPVDDMHGYRDELIISGNRTKKDAGGGLCQVSTTLFRSVLNAGLLVTSRTNHSYRVSYYEKGVGPGLDATVFDPAPDFKWKNDTGHAVYVQSHSQGTTITFDLYGTSDGRTSSVSAPVITNEKPPGDPIYIPTDTMYKDEQKQVEHPHPGATTDVTYSVTKDGKEIHHQVFHSVYRPWPSQFEVGTKDRSADLAISPSPSVTP